MNKSDFKASFMLEKSKIQGFIDFMKTKAEVLVPTSKYQIYRCQVQNAELLVYKSGIVIFDDNEQIFIIIRDFLTQNGINNPDFEKYESVELEEEKVGGWDETPKGVWLTPDQTDALIELLRQDLEYKISKGNERGRFVRGNQTLVLNKNGVVYTIGGFDNIIEILRKVITDNNPYGTYDRIVVFDEHGRWDKLGPVTFVLTDVMSHDLVELQLKGVKDSSLGRNTDHESFIQTIEEFSSFQSVLLTPEDINSEVAGRDEYQKWLDKKIEEFIGAQLLNLNEYTLLIVDENLSKYVDHTHRNIIQRHHRQSSALGVSSTVCNALIEKWKKDWYHKIGIQIEKNNLEEIRKHVQHGELLKSFLL